MDEILEIHTRVIDETGGLHGLLSEDRLLSAIMAPQNRYYYENADIVVCAATYAYHISQAHAFIDGNKRVAEVCTAAFIYANDATWSPSEDQLVDLFMSIAAGQLSRLQVEHIFRDWITI